MQGFEGRSGAIFRAGRIAATQLGQIGFVVMSRRNAAASVRDIPPGISGNSFVKASRQRWQVNSINQFTVACPALAARFINPI